jgi:hypothetical protein
MVALIIYNFPTVYPFYVLWTIHTQWKIFNVSLLFIVAHF